MDVEERLRIVERNLEEVVTHKELKQLLECEAKPKAYWGFEPSG